MSYLVGSVKDVPADAFIAAFAAHLKRNPKIELPTWVDLVKTAAHKELAPYDPDWYYIRAASIARKLYCKQGLGVGAFCRAYGTRNRRKGVVPEHKERSASGVVRHILKQLEKTNIVEKMEDTKGGRRVTSNGQREMDQVAGAIKLTTRSPVAIMDLASVAE